MMLPAAQCAGQTAEAVPNGLQRHATPSIKLGAIAISVSAVGEPREAVGIFQPQCPGDLKQAGRQQCEPCAHGCFGPGGSVSTAYWA